ncbi:MAG: type II toxin-antitoxin system HicA family toxin [Acidobacteria bacterium]|nr:type II toxin-antitoxin system HicA family toxin [Acidobacteriota bacterium]
MPLRPLPYRELKRKLEAAGFKEVSSKGSHVKFARVTQLGTYTAVVPHHREVPVGTIRSIIKQAGISPDEFERL